MFKIIIIIVWDIKVFSSTNAEGPEEGGGRREAEEVDGVWI